MQQRIDSHLEIGEVVAISEPGVQIHPNLPQCTHLRKCPDCSYLLAVVTRFREAADISSITSSLCPESEMDGLALFLSFLNGSPSREDAQKIFEHVNNCHACFQFFAENWGLYLTTKELNQTMSRES